MASENLEEILRSLEGFGERLYHDARNIRAQALSFKEERQLLGSIEESLRNLVGYLEQATIEISRVRQGAQALVSWSAVREQRMGQNFSLLQAELQKRLEELQGFLNPPKKPSSAPL